MESDEKIQAHIVSIWREPKKFLSIGGREECKRMTISNFFFPEIKFFIEKIVKIRRNY